MATLRGLVQDACDRIGIVRPTLIVGASDAQIRQLLAVASQEGREQARRYAWQGITFEHTFTTVAAEEQTGALPDGFDRFVSDTVFNRSKTRRLMGPMTAQEWAEYKGVSATGVFDAFRIRGSAFLYAPAPAAGETVAFDYVSKFWCTSAGGGAPTQSSWVTDDDVHFLDDELFTQGIVWRFQRSRGLDYAETFQTYELHLATLIGRDGGARRLDMSGRPRRRGTVTGIFGVVPSGALLDDDGSVLTE